MLLILFLLQNPICSLKALNSLLDLFAHSSGYKVNISKSIFMGLTIAKMVEEGIKGIITAPCRTSVKYIRIRLSDPLDSASLLGQNLIAILNSTKMQFTQWQSFHLYGGS